MAFNVCACVPWKIIIFLILWKAVYMLPNTDNVTLTIIDNISVKDLSFCEEGWKPHDQYCFKLFNSGLNWMDASNACKSLGGHLASIHSKEQNDFLETFYKGKYGVLLWIGLRDHDVDGIFVWHDETDVTYTNWNPGEPHGQYPSGDCVDLYLSRSGFFQFGKWLVFKCEHALPYMCQKKFATSAITSSNIDSETITTSAFTSSNIDSETIHILPNTVVDDVSEKYFSSCEEGWKPHDQYCFTLIKSSLSWDDASKDCRSMGGHLASIHSKEQNDFIQDFYIVGYRSFWIGLRDHDVDGIFAWDDETDVTYTNWNPGEPRGQYTSGDCVVMNFGESFIFQFGKWFAYECNYKYPYMCQKKSIATSAITSSNIDSETIATSAITSSNIDSETIATSSITSTFTDNETIISRSTRTDMAGTNGFISVTAFVITLLTVIVFLALMGGIVYKKRHWLEEKRVKIFYRRAEGPTSTEPYTKLVL